MLTVKARRVSDKNWDEAKVLAPIPMGRFGDPDEVASCVSWLASEDAGFVTGKCSIGPKRWLELMWLWFVGQTININGGQLFD